MGIEGSRVRAFEATSALLGEVGCPFRSYLYYPGPLRSGSSSPPHLSSLATRSRLGTLSVLTTQHQHTGRSLRRQKVTAFIAPDIQRSSCTFAPPTLAHLTCLEKDSRHGRGQSQRGGAPDQAGGDQLCSGDLCVSDPITWTPHGSASFQALGHRSGGTGRQDSRAGVPQHPTVLTIQCHR